MKSWTPNSFSRKEIAVEIEGWEMWMRSAANVMLSVSPAAMKYSSWRSEYRIETFLLARKCPSRVTAHTITWSLRRIQGASHVGIDLLLVDAPKASERFYGAPLRPIHAEVDDWPGD